MHVDETLIRSVVEQVLTRLGGNGNGAASAAAIRAVSACSPTSTRPWRRPAKPSSGFPAAPRRPQAHHRHIRRIAIDQCVELGTMEMEETKIGRLPHKIDKLERRGERPGRGVPAQRGL